MRSTLSPSAALPTFFLLGATKCGTTSLHQYMRQHPNVYMPYVKEIRFFNAPEEEFEKMIDTYPDFFEGVDAASVGEATPAYFRRPDVVIPRMKRIYGDWLFGDSAPRFIVIIRDPVQRAFSNYMHNVRLGRETRSFEQALDEEYDDLPDSRRRWRSYFHDGQYAYILSEWLETFDRDRFLIVLTEDLKVDADALMASIFDFLDVDTSQSVDTSQRLNAQGGSFRSAWLRSFMASPPDWVLSALKQMIPRTTRRSIRQFMDRLNRDNSATPRPSLDPELVQTLRERYEPSVEELEALIDRDLSHWKPGIKASMQ